MKFDDKSQISGHRRTEAEQKSIRARFIDALRRERYAGGTIPKHELEHALKAVGLWERNGRKA